MSPFLSMMVVALAVTGQALRAQEPKKAAEVDALRFLGPETALEVGRTTITPAEGGAPEITRFTTVYVKQDGSWLQPAVRDEVSRDVAPSNVPPPSDPGDSPAARAEQAFQAGNDPDAIAANRQAIARAPGDVGRHQSLALDLFAQGEYEQADAPLHAVLSVGPGWDWTTLIGHYSDASAYTGQLRGLEAFVKANPGSARARFVQAYHSISQGHGEAAIRPLRPRVRPRTTRSSSSSAELSVDPISIDPRDGPHRGPSRFASVRSTWSPSVGAGTISPGPGRGGTRR